MPCLGVPSFDGSEWLDVRRGVLPREKQDGVSSVSSSTRRCNELPDQVPANLIITEVAGPHRPSV